METSLLTRSQNLVNAVFDAFGRPPKDWNLRIFAKNFHDSGFSETNAGLMSQQYWDNGGQKKFINRCIFVQFTTRPHGQATSLQQAGPVQAGPVHGLALQAQTTGLGVGPSTATQHTNIAHAGSQVPTSSSINELVQATPSQRVQGGARSRQQAPNLVPQPEKVIKKEVIELSSDDEDVPSAQIGKKIMAAEQLVKKPFDRQTKNGRVSSKESSPSDQGSSAVGEHILKAGVVAPNSSPLGVQPAIDQAMLQTDRAHAQQPLKTGARMIQFRASIHPESGVFKYSKRGYNLEMPASSTFDDIKTAIKKELVRRVRSGRIFKRLEDDIGNEISLGTKDAKVILRRDWILDQYAGAQSGIVYASVNVWFEYENKRLTIRPDGNHPMMAKRPAHAPAPIPAPRKRKAVAKRVEEEAEEEAEKSGDEEGGDRDEPYNMRKRYRAHENCK